MDQLCYHYHYRLLHHLNVLMTDPKYKKKNNKLDGKFVANRIESCTSFSFFHNPNIGFSRFSKFSAPSIDISEPENEEAFFF